MVRLPVLILRGQITKSTAMELDMCRTATAKKSSYTILKRYGERNFRLKAEQIQVDRVAFRN